MKRLWTRLVFGLVLLLISLWFAGCASTEDNASVRPWNAPMGWENGLPSNMQEGR